MKKPDIFSAADILCLIGIGAIEWGLYNLNVWASVILAGLILFRIGLRTGGRL